MRSWQLDAWEWASRPAGWLILLVVTQFNYLSWLNLLKTFGSPLLLNGHLDLF